MTPTIISASSEYQSLTDCTAAVQRLYPRVATDDSRRQNTSHPTSEARFMPFY